MSESENSIPLDVPAALEALLFVSAEPVASSQMAIALEISLAAVEQGLKQLDGELQARGLRLQRHAGRCDFPRHLDDGPLAGDRRPRAGRRVAL